jgi:hypothetical protein
MQRPSPVGLVVKYRPDFRKCGGLFIRQRASCLIGARSKVEGRDTRVRSGASTTVAERRRFEAPNFEPAQCYQHATSQQRNSSATGRTSTGQNAQALE